MLKKFVAAALGSIPWVGGFLSAAAAVPIDEAGARDDDLRTQWLVEHQRKIGQLHGTLNDVAQRFESLGPEIEERVESPAYLSLVRQAFRTWDRAETDEKRKYIGSLLANAAGTKLTSDDVVRLFIAWLDQYHEAHFMVIRQIFQRRG